MPSAIVRAGLRLAVGAAAAVAALGADFGTRPAHAQSSPAAGWSLRFTPYGWLPFLDGDITVRGRTAEVNVTPIEVVEDLEMAWMSYVEARRGPFSVYNDIFYAKLGIDSDNARSRDRLSIDRSLGVEYEQAVIELGATYEVAKWVMGGSSKDPDVFVRSTALDVLAGARYWHQELDLKLAVSGALDLDGLIVSGDRATARSGTVDWLDPLIGLRVRHQLAPGQEVVLRGDVGGFDAGSTFSWQLVGTYSWDVAVRHGVLYSGVLGYRALSVDYEEGSGRRKYEYDVIQHGPVVGLRASF